MDARMIRPPPVNVGVNFWREFIKRPLVRLTTVMKSVLAPLGTVTEICVADADNTCAATPPKNTTLSEAVAPNPLPLIVTFVSSGIPDAGVKEVMAGDV